MPLDPLQLLPLARVLVRLFLGFSAARLMVLRRVSWSSRSYSFRRAWNLDELLVTDVGVVQHRDGGAWVPAA